MSRSFHATSRNFPTGNKAGMQHAQVANMIQQGLAVINQDRFDEAKLIYEQVLKIDPKHFDALQLLGAICIQLKEYLQAVQFLSKALQINPHHAAAYSNYANALKELSRFDEALISANKAISLNPQFAEAQVNRGNALKELGHLEEALASYDQAIEISPQYADAYNNRGNALKELGRLDEALASYDQAIEIRPDYSEVLWNKSLLYLLSGDLSNGWKLFESGWDARERGIKSEHRKALWLGEQPLEGKTILLHAEQGLGDTLQFCRYVPLVAQLGATVILEVQAPLVSLLKSLEGVSTILAHGQALPEFDYHCPLMSLPLAFKTELDTIPAQIPYLSCSEEKKLYWKEKLGPKTRPRVGLVWSSVSTFKGDNKRSLTLAQFLPMLPAEGLEYICLQKEIKEHDKDLLVSKPQIQFFGDQFQDFSDTAALIENIDLVISTCTSTPLVAGALGKPVWMLLSFMPDWRWLLGRKDSPWYPSATLYRQDKAGDWDGVLKRVRADLGKKLSLFRGFLGQ
jgi:tetratricopeptide (TPR) repeat protein